MTRNTSSNSIIQLMIRRITVSNDPQTLMTFSKDEKINLYRETNKQTAQVESQQANLSFWGRIPT